MSWEIVAMVAVIFGFMFGIMYLEYEGLIMPVLGILVSISTNES